MQLRGFDQPLSAIAEPWRQEFHQEQTFHPCKVVADSGAAELECARQLAEVGKSSGLARGKCEKLRQRIEVGDVSQLVHVPLDECFYVVRVPVNASERRGMSSTFDEPVRMRRTEARFASTVGLRAANSSGTRWTSSRTACRSRRATKPVTSARAAASVAASSKV